MRYQSVHIPHEVVQRTRYAVFLPSYTNHHPPSYEDKTGDNCSVVAKSDVMIGKVQIAARIKPASSGGNGISSVICASEEVGRILVGTRNGVNSSSFA